MKLKKPLGGVLVLGLLATSPTHVSADQSEGYIFISGNVPAFFELWVRGVPGDLDLGPRVVVTDRLLGLLHVKYNINLQGLSLQSDTANGTPTDSAGTDWGGVISYKIGGGPTCMTVGGAAGAVASQVINSGNAVGTLGGGADVHHLDVEDLATNFGSGLEEDCPVYGSWAGINQDLPLAGTYSMKITITMTSF